MVITIGVADLETTGLSQHDGHRIIETAFILYEYNTETHDVKAIGKFVKRTNPDRSIDPKSQAVHHISIDDLAGEPMWEDIVDQVVKILKRIDLLVCHNISFDGPFLVGEIARVGRQVPDVETFCTMDNGRFATYDGMVPNLRRLCEAFDIEYDLAKSHGALYDVQLTAQCLFLGLKQGYYKLPDLSKLETTA